MKTFDIDQWVRPNIKALKPYSSARDEFSGQNMVFLDANENPFGTYNRYPDPYQKEVKRELALLKGVSENQLFLGNGSDEVIDLLFKLSCSPGTDKILTFGPTYGMYQVTADIYDIPLDVIPLDENFQLPWDRIESIDLDAYKMIFICSPNNPTGNLIKGVDKLLQSTNTLVVVDEAYGDFCKENSCINSLDKYKNVIVLQTLSKSFGLAGVRLGLGIANERIIAYLNKVKPPYNISLPNQEEVLNQLRAKDIIEEQITTILTEKERLKTALEKCEFVTNVFTSDANFILFQVDDADLRYAEFLENGIVVRNRSKQIDNALRVSVGSSTENQKFIEVLNQFKS